MREKVCSVLNRMQVKISEFMLYGLHLLFYFFDPLKSLEKKNVGSLVVTDVFCVWFIHLFVTYTHKFTIFFSLFCHKQRKSMCMVSILWMFLPPMRRKYRFFNYDCHVIIWYSVWMQMLMPDDSIFIFVAKFLLCDKSNMIKQFRTLH